MLSNWTCNWYVALDPLMGTAITGSPLTIVSALRNSVAMRPLPGVNATEERSRVTPLPARARNALVRAPPPKTASVCPQDAQPPAPGHPGGTTTSGPIPAGLADLIPGGTPTFWPNTVGVMDAAGRLIETSFQLAMMNPPVRHLLSRHIGAVSDRMTT